MNTLTDGMWMEHPDSIMRRARVASARNPGAADEIAARDTDHIRSLIAALGSQGGAAADDLRVLLHAELIRRIRVAA